MEDEKVIRIFKSIFKGVPEPTVIHTFFPEEKIAKCTTWQEVDKVDQTMVEDLGIERCCIKVVVEPRRTFVSAWTEKRHDGNPYMSSPYGINAEELAQLLREMLEETLKGNG